jgi:4-amino-4-deoxy-L-arabinose transferase-like glycosyltransferase
VNGLNPALVTQRAARRLPRVPLLLLCAAYLLPGMFGRDPWRGADLTTFGQMVAMAEGRTSWWQPLLGGVPTDAAPLPHWLGAVAIAATAPWLDAALAARLPFALLLGAVLALVWYTTFHLARTEAAQPVAFAFGGEAHPVDYARAMADGALLALMATLGLLQLGHETTPELLQLAGVALFLYALAAAPYRSWKPRAAVVAALAVLAASGAPSMALLLGVGGTLLCHRSAYAQVRHFARWVALATLLGAALALLLGAWPWRAVGVEPGNLPGIARQWLWFLWPAWPLALWTLWRWRRHLLHRHMSVPLLAVLVACGANLAMNGSDRALMLGLPGLAVLAAFALPTLRRSASAAVDWFSMLFFTLCALAIWVIYAAMHTGTPAKTAANVTKLAPGFEPTFSALALVLALAGSIAWVALVRWRTGRHQDALWKSLVLPAGGVALCWLLLMTLWLPLLDYARSPRPWVQRLAEHVPADACVAAPGLSLSHTAALEHFGGWRVDARPQGGADCPRQVRVFRQGRHEPLPPAPPGWSPLAEVMRPTDRNEITAIYQRVGNPSERGTEGSTGSGAGDVAAPGR